MKNIHLIMPMGGAGSRFQKNGFEEPKPLIKINGHPFFYWATRSITKNIKVKDITFVILKEHSEKFNLDQSINNYFPSAKIIIIPKLLDGAVLTALEGIKDINDDAPIIINDCDHAFECKKFDNYCNGPTFFNQEDGILLSFQSSKPCYSYLKLNQNNDVIGTIEKKVASNHAICGVYCFNNQATFAKSAQRYLKNCEYEEFFMSGVYNDLIKNGGRVSFFDCDHHISFGTPQEYEEAKNNPIFKMLKEHR